MKTTYCGCLDSQHSYQCTDSEVKFLRCYDDNYCYGCDTRMVAKVGQCAAAVDRNASFLVTSVTNGTLVSVVQYFDHLCDAYTRFNYHLLSGSCGQQIVMLEERLYALKYECSPTTEKGTVLSHKKEDIDRGLKIISALLHKTSKPHTKGEH